MSVESRAHSVLLNFPLAKKIAKRFYQFSNVVIFRPKKSEGKIERVTPDDKYEYLFGYYDKSPWDISNRYMLCIRVKNAYKNAAPKELAEIVLIDTEKNNLVKVIAKTNTWNVQQGCMLGWLGPKFDQEIFYNDCRDGKYCGVIKNINDGSEKIFETPFYSVSNDGKVAISLDFSRLHRLRPGYGYSNLKDKTKDEKIPDGPCVWKIDLKTGRVSPILAYKQLYNFEHRKDMEKAEHKVNHLMLSPDGKRFMLIHRWIKGGKKISRLLTCDIDGRSLYNLSDGGMVSHCYWKNNKEILAYCRKDKKNGYFLMKDKTNEYKQKWEFLTSDGHPSYSPDGNLVVTDTYPNKKRLSTIRILSDTTSTIIAKVRAPFKYDNDTRCDLHPRWSRDGKKVCFDGCFDGKRGVYTVDVVNNSMVKLGSKLSKIGGRKVLFVINTCRDCGPTKVMFNIIKNLDCSKFEPIILTLSEEGDNSNIEEILPYVRYNFLCKMKKTDIIFGKLDKLKDTITKISPDVIHTTGVFPDYAIAKIFSNNQVVTMHNYAPFDYVSKFGKIKGLILIKMQYFAAKHAKKTIACSKSLSELYSKCGMDFEYIQNGIDLNRYHQNNNKKRLRKKLGLRAGSFIFIYTGRFVPGKNIDFALQAFSKIYKNSDKTSFLLLGDGPELELLRQKYGDVNNITFVGKVSNVEEYLMASDVYISASVSEGLPNGVLEAMACGLPVVLSDIPQHREILGRGKNGGLIFGLSSVQKCANTLKEISTVSKINKIAEDATKNIKMNFDGRGMSIKYQKVYSDIIRDNSGTILIKGNEHLFFDDLGNVYSYYKSYSIVSRVIRKIFRKMHFMLFDSFFYGKWKKILESCNNVIIFDSKSEYTASLPRYIKNKNPNIRIIFWYWNPLRLYNGQLVRDKYIDEIWTYNRFDAEDKHIKYNTQFYHFKNNFDNNVIGTNSNADVVFVGRDKGRSAVLKSIEDVLDSKNISHDFIVVETKRDFVDYSTYLKKINSSKCIVDLVPEPFFGLTLRPMEALFFGKKLITNNKDIVHCSFYNKNNIFIIGVDDVDRISSFLDSPYTEISKEIVDYYSYEYWLSRMVEGVEASRYEK